MEKLLINTPQNVNIEYRLASVGDRIFSAIIDYIIILSYFFLIYIVLAYSGLFENEDYWLIIGVFSLFQLPALFYHLYMEIFLDGQSIGKRLLKLKVVKVDGSRATSYEYFIRWTLSIVDVWMLQGVIGFLSIILTKKSQRIGDIAADTTVISLKANTNIGQTVLENLVTTYQPTFPKVVLLSDRDINIIKSSYREALANTNHTLLAKLSAKITEITGHQKGNFSDIGFIDTVIKDHFYYHHEEK